MGSQLYRSRFFYVFDGGRGDRRLSVPVGGGGKTGAASEMLPDQSRRSDWEGSPRVEGLYIPVRKVLEPGKRGEEGSRNIDLLGCYREKGEIASGESRTVASDFPGGRGER